MFYDHLKVFFFSFGFSLLAVMVWKIISMWPKAQPIKYIYEMREWKWKFKRSEKKNKKKSINLKVKYDFIELNPEQLLFILYFIVGNKFPFPVLLYKYTKKKHFLHICFFCCFVYPQMSHRFVTFRFFAHFIYLLL